MAYAQAVAASSSNVNTASPGFTSLDGVTLTAGKSRVLLTGQTTKSQNGVWIYQGSATAMTRPVAPDQYKTGNVLDNATIVWVTGGTIGAGTVWGLDPASVIRVDTTNHTLTKIALPPVQARAASTGNLVSLASVTLLDGVSLAGNGLAGSDIVLLKDQSTATQNGLYWANPSGTMAATTEPLVPERSIAVSEGDLNRNTQWVLSTKTPITVGATSLTFSKAWARTVDAAYYVSTVGDDTFDGLSPGTANLTVAHALSSIGYANGSALAGTATVTLNSTTVTFTVAQTLPSGTILTFSSQAAVYFFVSAPTSASTTAVLTSPYPGATTSGVTVTTAISNAGKINLLGGSVPAPQGGIVLGRNQHVAGLGIMVTIIQGSATGVSSDAAVTLASSRSQLRDVSVNVGVAGGVCVRITQSGSNQNSRLSNIFAQNQTTNAIAFGIGDNTTGDVSEVVLTGCDSVGNGTGYHMKISAGIGNVVDISNFGGNSQNQNYGVWVDGGCLVSRGLNFEGSTTADILLSLPGLGNTSIVGGRSETAGRFVVSHAALTYTTCRIADYTALALTNSDGQGIQILGAGPITFENVSMAGQSCPQYIALPFGASDSDFPTIVTARDCTSDHPYLFGTTWSRPNVIIRSKGSRFNGDRDFQSWSRSTQPERWVRRFNITSSAQVITINPFFFDEACINLVEANNAVAPVLLAGSLGQRVTLTYQQDGYGGWSYKWPINCAFNGWSGPPSNVTTGRNRQSCAFKWNGNYWEQVGEVSNIVPPTPVPTPVTDSFSTGSAFWLNVPDTLPVQTSATAVTRWEHLPGGGSLGISGGHCATLCIGYLGDINGATGFLGTGAAAVIETGMATQSVGISVTFTWQTIEGIITNYLDDQTFASFAVITGFIQVRAYNHTVLTNYGNLATGGGEGGLVMTAGHTYTLLVQCTSTGWTITLTDVTASKTFGPQSIAFQGNDKQNFGSFTKHGFFSADGVATTAAKFSQFKVS